MKKLLFPAAALAVALSVPPAMADDQNGPDKHPKQERADRPDKPDRGDNMKGPNANAPGGGAMQGPNGGDNDRNNGDRGDNNRNNEIGRAHV